MSDGYRRSQLRLGGAITAVIGALLTAAPVIECASGASADEAAALQAPAPTLAACWAQTKPLSQPVPMLLTVLGAVTGLGAALGRDAQPGHRLADAPSGARATVIRSTVLPTTTHEAPVRDAIELSQELDLGTLRSGAERARPATLMDMVAIGASADPYARQARAPDARPQCVPVGLYVPEGASDALTIMVDPGHERASDASVSQRTWESPFRTISAALEHARALTRAQGQPVQVRVMPGLYQEALRVPPRVSVINHKMPDVPDLTRQRAWLDGMSDVDHPERVTLLPAARAPLAILLEAGAQQRLCGLHVIGREGAPQVGVRAEHVTGLHLSCCALQGFDQGAIQLNASGSSASGGEVLLTACILRDNRGRKGAALGLRGGAVRLEGCLLEGNLARSGGAIYAQQTRPLTLVDTTLCDNTARGVGELPDAMTLLEGAWAELTGLGGAIAMEQGQLKLERVTLRDNRASAGGGGLALLGAQAIIAGIKEIPCVISGSGGSRGGAVLMVGRVASRATLKAEHLHLTQNIARDEGGGLWAAGASACQLRHSTIAQNEVRAPGGTGAGAHLTLGARLWGSALALRANKCDGPGAGVIALNASLTLRERSLIQDNASRAGRGAALYIETSASSALDALVARGELELPLTLDLSQLELIGNLAGRSPAAAFVGNLDTTPTLALRLSLGEGIAWRANRVLGAPVDKEPIAIHWCGELVMSSARLELGERVLS